MIELTRLRTDFTMAWLSNTRDLMTIDERWGVITYSPFPAAPGRVYALWNSGTTNDYIRFLSTNSWIWGSHWGEAIERACTVEDEE
jgi:hypothetical protein